MEARNGYVENDATIGEARRFARQSDHVALFLAEATRPGGWTRRILVHEGYTRWAGDHRRRVLGRNVLYDALEGSGLPAVRGPGSARGFRLRLIDDYDDDGPDDDA